MTYLSPGENTNKQTPKSSARAFFTAIILSVMVGHVLCEDCVFCKVYLRTHQAPQCSGVYTGDFKLPQM